MIRLLPALLFVATVFAPAGAQAQQLAASLRAGTQGIGVGVTTPLLPNVNGRIDANFFSYSTDGVQVVDDIDVSYDADARLLFISALADWHPFDNTLRLSAGLLYNGLEGNGVIRPDEPIEAGNNTFTPEEVGDLGIDVSFGSSIAPYIGLGIGNALSRRVGFLFDLGVIYAGSPSVEMNASGMLTPTAEEAPQIEENLSWAQWYPVLSLGVSTRLF